MAVVIASSLRKELSGDPLFDGVSFTVNRRDRVALSGPNGAGKTTLLRMLAGETELHGGELAFAKGTRLALHDQRPPVARGLTLRDYAFSGASDLIALEQELRTLEEAMAAGSHDPATLRRYAHAQGQLEHAGGWDWRERAASALRGLGFRDEDFDRSLDTFSGGELTRASLGRALAGDPDLLLLDEPTNHLDVASLEWLEELLTSLDAAVILVAHDRWFLEAVTTAVLELEAGRSLFFAGPWHEWRREKEARALAAGKQIARHEADIARLERFVARFRYKKSKAKQAQAKLTQIARLEKERRTVASELDALTKRTKALGFDFLKPPRSGRTVVAAEGLDVYAGERRLLEGVSLAVERDEHVALVGPNGSGKTTLVEALLARPLGYGVVPAYFSQQGTELDERGSVLDCAQRATGLQRPQAQKLLGRFLFTGWEMHERPVAALSGGERRRLSLALLVASGANFLVLDEPTNHLDLESREALEAALEAFPGTILLVSHDRALLDAVARRTLAIEDGTVRSYDGGWADYARLASERAMLRGQTQGQTLSQAPDTSKRDARQSPPAAARRRPDLAGIEAEIEAKEAEVADIERRLAEDWANVDTAAAYRRAREELEQLLARWEQLFEQTSA
ncbi:MAG TPA: ABC-F family ATP-binding cassette domain-containing protein [Gaiellaceae bacterium]|nr:ABC-F family ATP-binding cassette domain-containing protein [Gaiellaceae bacterium]